LRPAWANSSQDPISKITRAKWTGGVTQAVELLLCKSKALSSNPSYQNNKKIKNKKVSLTIDKDPENKHANRDTPEDGCLTNRHSARETRERRRGVCGLDWGECPARAPVLKFHLHCEVGGQCAEVGPLEMSGIR
jgi:hypothetical protein